MKVTSEKLPKSLLALDIELDKEQVEKGLDRAARRLSQKYNIPGFRKGKAPRFIVENYFGRPALIEEASEDLVNKAFKDALEQEKINPVGRANLETVKFDEPPFSFRVTVPVDPTTALPDYRAIRVPYEPREVTDAMFDEAMDSRRERHVVLREPEEARPAKQGDQLTVQLESFLDGEPLETRDEGADVPETNVVLEPGRLIPGLYEGLLGIEPGETREITAHMPEDHENERVRDKDVSFKVTLKRLQDRLLPEWDELPTLEEEEITLDELREKTRNELAESVRTNQERETIDAYLKQLVEQTEYDIPDALIEQEADDLLHQRGHELERYGITLDQMLQYRGQTHDDAVDELGLADVRASDDGQDGLDLGHGRDSSARSVMASTTSAKVMSDVSSSWTPSAAVWKSTSLESSRSRRRTWSRSWSSVSFPAMSPARRRRRASGEAVSRMRRSASG